MAVDPATLRLRYPAFAQVADPTISYWLTDAARIVTPSWGADQEPATLALAAHCMATTPGVLTGTMTGEVAALAGAGVTDFKSGSFVARISDEAVKRAAAGGYDATVYGQEFATYLRRNVNTFGTSAPGGLPCDNYGFNGWAGPIPAVWPC